MDLILEQGLPHQEAAVKAVCDVFQDMYFDAPRFSYANPVIDLKDVQLVRNLHDLQMNIREEDRRNHDIGDCLTLDVKMETGTGKTYVYTKLMYELHQRYGFHKFIIIVPTLAIKAGTASFLQDPYVRRHFADDCGYSTDLSALVLSAQKRKKGKAFFPSVVTDFFQGSFQNRRKMYVLVSNMHLLSASKSSMMGRDDYGYAAGGFYRPLDALRSTRPIVILDEAHRFSRDQKSYQVIRDELKPQCIIRFGATFPEVTHGRGKNKVTEKDYENLVYDLNACKSFNMGLIKGVAKEHFEPISKKEEKLKITSIDSREAVHFQYVKEKGEHQSFTLKQGDPLSIISSDLDGITVTAIGRSSVSFSNGVEKSTGMEMEVSAMMPSYQDQMMRLALQRHFETERENFSGRKNKIKTLALFFIDDISSYRKNEEGKMPYLLQSFETLLREQMIATRDSLSDEESEYKAYLTASLADLSACHAGYFAQDNSDSDEAIAKEVDEILHGKKELLSFKHPDGSWNTRRFLFSKWTLKEGWDNPNVFTICKLRSSGSEISKLQEVGRGLRLPVDEYGNRISNELFYLNYIVDFTEADFAQKLVDQINEDVPETSHISMAFIEKVAAKKKMDPNQLFTELLVKGYLDYKYNVSPSKRNAFYHEYPEFNVGVDCDKVKDRNQRTEHPVAIRRAVYEELREFWERVNRNYLLFFDRELDHKLDGILDDILEHQHVLRQVVMTSERSRIRGGDVDGPVQLLQETGVQYTISRAIPYKEFLIRLARLTNIPVAVLHGAIHRYAMSHGPISAKLFNEASAARFCEAFRLWKAKHLAGHFRYAMSGARNKKTALSDEQGKPYTEIKQGRIGIRFEEGMPCAKYLYDSMAYDSPLELENIKSGDIEEVVVYGKIPRSSIAIPTFAGSTYSPDFMYIVKKKNGMKELHLIVETKDKAEKDLSLEENLKIDCAKVFFDTLSKEGYKVYFHKQMKGDKMKEIVDEVVYNN